MIIIEGDMHVFLYVPWYPETQDGLNEPWAGPSLISFLFFSYLKYKNSLSFPISKWRQEIRDRLGDLYKVIMWAYLLAAIILVCNKNDWSDTLYFLNIQKT